MWAQLILVNEVLDYRHSLLVKPYQLPHHLQIPPQYSKHSIVSPEAIPYIFMHLEQLPLAELMPKLMASQF